MEILHEIISLFHTMKIHTSPKIAYASFQWLGAIKAIGVKATAAAGENPAGAIGVKMTRRAEVVFVDPYQKFISFRSPDRGLRKISLKGTNLEHYLNELKKGDIVEVTYTEALAISLQPAD